MLLKVGILINNDQKEQQENALFKRGSVQSQGHTEGSAELPATDLHIHVLPKQHKKHFCFSWASKEHQMN